MSENEEQADMEDHRIDSMLIMASMVIDSELRVDGLR